MSNTKDAMRYGVSALCIVLAIGAGIWIAGKTITGVGNWFYSSTYGSPEERAKQAQEEKADKEAWKTDPRNPKVAGQACLDAGGVPSYSGWDGELTDCKIIQEKKFDKE